MKEIPLSRGKVALVDDEDYESLARWKWSAWEHRNGDFYAVRTIQHGGRQSTIRMHRLVCMPGTGQVVDHINHDTLDNRRMNLRACTAKENLRNRRVNPRHSSRYKGVRRRKDTGRWSAQITCNKRAIALGCFASEREAREAYDVAALRLFGEFARLNP